MIICDAVGGLNNRLRCLVSCMRISDDIKLIWTVKENQVHLWCSFNSLFKNKFEVFLTKEECFSKYENVPVFSDYKFIKLSGDEIDINHLDVDNWEKIIPNKLKDDVIKNIKKLEPVDYIKNEVNKFKKGFSEDVITVSVRTWKDADRNINNNGRYFEIDKVFNEMDKYVNNRFFVTCDHQETFDEIYKRYKERVIYTTKRTFFGDYKTVEGIQDSVIDLLLGGINKKIIATIGSSFCDMQWWFGGGNSTMKMINAHPGR